MSETTQPEPTPDPQELQRMLENAVTLGQGITARVYDERKRRLERRQPPESYFKDEPRLSAAFAGTAKIDFPQREGYEYAELITPPAQMWPENNQLTVRHHSKLAEEALQELVATYRIQRLGNATLLLTTTIEDITERNIWKQARDDTGPRLHDDYAVHCEMAGIRMARYSSDSYRARREEEALGLHNAGIPEAQELLTLLNEGTVRMPNGQNPY